MTKTVNEILKKLESGVKEVFSSERYHQFLNAMSTFHRYSYNNIMLILNQRPDATRVAGYNTWKKLNRYVKKGEKGIQILAPQKYKAKKEVEVPVLDENNNPVLDSNGNKITEKKIKDVEQIRFVPVYVFDISQTDGEPLPSILKVNELNGVVPEKDVIMKALQRMSPFIIEFENITSGAKGYCNFSKKKIAIKEGMSDLHTIKTGIHEVAHALLHNPKFTDTQSRNTIEVQAESIAYVVSQRLGLDTSDYSFGYIASWASDKELSDLRKSLQVIQETSQYIIDRIEQALDREQTRDEVEQKSEIEPVAEECNPDLSRVIQKNDDEAVMKKRYLDIYNVEHIRDDLEALIAHNVALSETLFHMRLPSVGIQYSEHPSFIKGLLYSINAFSEKVLQIEKELMQLQQEALDKNDNSPPKYRIDYVLNYTVDGENGHSYGSYNIGEGCPRLIDQIKAGINRGTSKPFFPGVSLDRSNFLTECLIPSLEEAKRIELLQSSKIESLYRKNFQKEYRPSTMKRGIKERIASAKLQSEMKKTEEPKVTKEVEIHKSR